MPYHDGFYGAVIGCTWCTWAPSCTLVYSRVFYSFTVLAVSISTIRWCLGQKSWNTFPLVVGYKGAYYNLINRVGDSLFNFIVFQRRQSKLLKLWTDYLLRDNIKYRKNPTNLTVAGSRHLVQFELLSHEELCTRLLSSIISESWLQCDTHM